MKKETPREIEYWNILEQIVIRVHAWGMVMLYYIPKLKEAGISDKDIKKHFLELLEAYTGEQLYQSNVQKKKMS